MRRSLLALLSFSALAGCSSVPANGVAGAAYAGPAIIAAAPYAAAATPTIIESLPQIALLTSPTFWIVGPLAGELERLHRLQAPSEYALIHDDGRIETSKFSGPGEDFDRRREAAARFVACGEFGPIVKGKRHGLYESHWTNGAVASRGHYRNDRRDGEWHEWWPDGRLRSHGSYFDGKKCGRWGYLHPNGQVERLEEYEGGSRKYLVRWHYIRGKSFDETTRP